MIDKKLLYACMQDDEFEKILSNDAVLDELERMKYNKCDEYFQFLFSTQNLFNINHISIQPITPAIWCFLWILENAYTLRKKDITNDDTDMFLYIITHGIKNLNAGSLTDLYQKSKGFCKNNGLDYEEARADLKTLVALSFKPLEMLPSINTASSDDNIFDVDWLLRLCGIVAKKTNYTIDYVMYQMSLNTCYYYYVDYQREFDTKGLIKKHSDGEINKAIWERTIELAEDYYRENYMEK